MISFTKKKRKYVFLMGGFGNVLFQISFALKLMEECKCEVYVVPFLTRHNFFTKIIGWKIHEVSYNFLLQPNNIKIQNFSNLKTLGVFLLAKISSILNKPFLYTFFLNDNSMISNELGRSKYFFGYYQNKVFLQKNKKFIHQLSTILQSNLTNNSKKIEDSIIVHFRYGDSIWAKKNEAYYSVIREKLRASKMKIYIPTDSPEIAEEFFKNIPNKIIISSDPLSDFAQMISASELYVAPSTFSFWAYLCLRNNSIAYLPKLMESKFGLIGKSKAVVIG